MGSTQIFNWTRRRFGVFGFVNEEYLSLVGARVVLFVVVQAGLRLRAREHLWCYLALLRVSVFLCLEDDGLFEAVLWFFSLILRKFYIRHSSAANVAKISSNFALITGNEM
jgi:hypothetical protein